MMKNETSANPYHPASAEPRQITPNAKALKYIAHGVYLQLFLGVAMLAISAIDIDTGRLFNGPQACGILLVGLGLNSIIYIHRFTKSLR
jgi:hypothetical protein